jgi:hypothetical protein
MIQEDRNDWYNALKKLLQLEYGIDDKESEYLIDAVSEFSVACTRDFFDFVEDEIHLVNIWDKKRFIIGINSDILIDYKQSLYNEEVEDDTNK